MNALSVSLCTCMRAFLAYRFLAPITFYLLCKSNMKLLVRAIDYYRKMILAGYMILKKPYNDILYGGVRYTLLLNERIFHL
jgi:hypothetical protein